MTKNFQKGRQRTFRKVDRIFGKVDKELSERSTKNVRKVDKELSERLTKNFQKGKTNFQKGKKNFQKGQQRNFRKVNKKLSVRSTKNLQKGRQRTFRKVNKEFSEIDK